MGYHCDIYCENEHFNGHFDDIVPGWYPFQCIKCDSNRFANLPCFDDMCNQVQKQDLTDEEYEKLSIEQIYKPIPQREDGSYDLSQLNITFKTREQIEKEYKEYFEDMMKQFKEMNAKVTVHGNVFVAEIRPENKEV